MKCSCGKLAIRQKMKGNIAQSYARYSCSCGKATEWCSDLVLNQEKTLREDWKSINESE